MSYVKLTPRSVGRTIKRMFAILEQMRERDLSSAGISHIDGLPIRPESPLVRCQQPNALIRCGSLAKIRIGEENAAGPAKRWMESRADCR